MASATTVVVNPNPITVAASTPVGTPIGQAVGQSNGPGPGSYIFVVVLPDQVVAPVTLDGYFAISSDVATDGQISVAAPLVVGVYVVRVRYWKGSGKQFALADVTINVV